MMMRAGTGEDVGPEQKSGGGGVKLEGRFLKVWLANEKAFGTRKDSVWVEQRRNQREEQHHTIQ